jgi:hypothetical protein
MYNLTKRYLNEIDLNIRFMIYSVNREEHAFVYPILFFSLLKYTFFINPLFLKLTKNYIDF